MIGVYRNFVNI